MSEDNLSLPNPSNNPSEFNTLSSLECFLKTIQTIKEILTKVEKNNEPAYLTINELLQNVEFNLLNEIQQTNVKLSQPPESIERDTPSVDSTPFKIRLLLERARQAMNPNQD